MDPTIHALLFVLGFYFIIDHLFHYGNNFYCKVKSKYFSNHEDDH